MRQKIFLNDSWYFTPDCPADLKDLKQPSETMIPVRLPHSVCEMPLHYFDESIYQKLSAYLLIFQAEKEWQGKRIRLVTDGAAHHSRVFLNGTLAGTHACGYTAFSMDISDLIHFGGENVLAVELDSRESLNQPPFGYAVDYMTYGGLYREVWLEICEPACIEDVFVSAELSSEDRNPVWLVSEITCSREAEGLEIRQSIRQEGEADFRVLTTCPARQTLNLRLDPGKVELWSPEHPVLYEVRTELLQDGTVLDIRDVRTGFRKAEFRKDGFYLNQKKVRLRGLNRHQSYPYVGYAMPERMQRMDARICKEELGLNAVRTSHYPQSHAFLEECDRLGLLVFTEIPGWQHIGDASWKEQAVRNTEDMVRQYRNHPSIILWGVRINESADDDELYARTNKAAHALDPTRQTGGVRCIRNSRLLEDVYTYNDFVHDGTNRGCRKKSDVTSDREKGYLISEYNGHMYPTKAFDDEIHRTEHALRHARVLDACAGQEDIAGSFGWCFADYNTHQDFGSGDRVCYHGVLDLFRNPKPAAAIYAMQQEETPVLELSSSMDIGEHPACTHGKTYLFSNADAVRMYKNGRLIREYKGSGTSFRHLKHGPVLISDFVGDVLETKEGYRPKTAALLKDGINAVALYGQDHLPFGILLKMARLLVLHGVKIQEATDLYTKYVGDWGQKSVTYQFDALKDGKVVSRIIREPVRAVGLEIRCDQTTLQEGSTYDVAAVRIRAVDQNGNLLPYFQEPLRLEIRGELELIGPSLISLSGGMGGTYVKTTGKTGKARLQITNSQAGEYTVDFEILERKQA